jgi:hypothetical protein
VAKRREDSKTPTKLHSSNEKIINGICIVAAFLVSAAFIIPLLFMLAEFFTSKRHSIIYEMFNHGDNHNKRDGRPNL